MANWYTTNYVFVGDKEDVDALYDKLKEIEIAADPNDSDDYDILWLGRVVEALGGSVKEIPCRGEWNGLEKRDGRVYFDTSTANGNCNGVMDLICEYYESLKYFYRYDSDTPLTNDKKGKYFERYKIDIQTPKGECYEEYFPTEEEALKFLSEKTGRDLSSKEDVDNLRHEWEDLEDGYAYVWLVEFEYCSREDELGYRFLSDMFWQSRFTEEENEDEEDEEFEFEEEDEENDEEESH